MTAASPRRDILIINGACQGIDLILGLGEKFEFR